MKTRFLVVLFVLLIAPLCGRSQEPHTEDNHSVTINILGLDYAYEHSLGKKFTITGRVGVSFGVGWMYGGFGDAAHSKFSWLTVPTIGVEGRYYHGFDRRAAKGRSTSHNSGSFLSMRAQYYFPFGLSSKNVEISGGAVVFTPGWGFRRVWRDKWLFEFITGINLGINMPRRIYCDVDNEFFWAPALNVRFGYKF